MTAEERVMRLLTEANPVPDVDSFDLVELDATKYLATLNQRSSDMTKTEDRTAEQVARRRRPLVALATSAMAVLIAVAVAWFGLIRDDDIAPAGIAVVQEFARDVSSGATDLSEYVSEGATFGPMTVPLDDDLAAFWAGLDTRLTVSNCEQTAQVVRCDYEWTDRIREAQERPEFGILTFLIEGSRVGSISRDWDDEASRWLDAGDPVIHYMEWLNETYPGWELDLDWIGDPAEIGGGYAPLSHDDPVHNARYAEALTRHVDEYAQDLTAIGGLPD